jgi:hypothetical protein
MSAYIKKKIREMMWEHMSVIPVLGRPRQMDHKFKGNLST